MSMGQVIRLQSRNISNDDPVFVIAEVGINHNGDAKLAARLIREAHRAGADAVKLQTYTTEKRVAAGSPIFDLLKRCELSYEVQRELFGLGQELGLLMFSTPFDKEAVDFLAEAGCALYKVASFDVVNKPLLRKICEKKRAVIVSRGMASDAELGEALHLFDEAGIGAAVLHCVSAYPVSSFADLHLATIAFLQKEFGRVVGFSDHTVGVNASVWAVAAGARIIEKHFTLDTGMEGPDHPISADPATLSSMIRQIRLVEQALGEPVHGPVEVEKDILQYRRKMD